MKRIINFILIIIITVSVSSCKKWLDVRPGTEVKEQTLFTTEAGFREATMGVYLQMQSKLYANSLSATVISAMAQNYQTTTAGHTFIEHAKFNFTSPLVINSIDSIWSGLYKGIGGVNNILANIDDKKTLFTGNHFNLTKGELLGLRAYMHFDLLRMFGPVPINSGAKVSIPYMKTFSRNVGPLNTLSEVANLCLEDLNQAESLLSVHQTIDYEISRDSYTTYTRNHFNYWAVKALKARIYLWIGDKVNALKYANEVIASNQFPFITSAAFSNTSAIDRTFSTEHVFALNIPKMFGNLNNYFKIDGITTFQARTLYLSTTNMNNTFELATGGSTDYRYLHLIKASNGFSTTAKFWQDGFDSNVATSLRIANQMPLIRLTEAYYIAIESTNDLNEALTLFNKVRANRGLDKLAGPLTEASRITELTKEYTKEFYAEGQTFFYYKRTGNLNLPRLTTAMKMENFVFPLPQSEMEFGNR